jgi:transcription termination/antitermination protein NusG
LGKQAHNTGKNWYVLHTYSGYEDAVKTALEQRIDSCNMQDYIFRVEVPKVEEMTIRRGEKVKEQKRLFPGYVLVEMNVTDESWYVARNTPNVTGFVGSGNIPVAVTLEEFGIIEKHVGSTETSYKIKIKNGDVITILDGPFSGYEGQVSEVDATKGKVKVKISIFGRDTPVELDFGQVKKK